MEKTHWIERDSMVVYKSVKIAISLLPKELQLDARNYVTDYWFYGIEADPNVNPMAYVVYVLNKPQTDANNKKYERWKKWWRPGCTWQKEEKPKVVENCKNKKPNVNVNVNENVNENVNGNENGNENANENEKKKNKKVNNKVVYSELFESFWKAYPKKKGKQKAREAWENAIKWGNDPKYLITKAWEYATEIKLKRVEEKFIKFAQWWLNEWRFDDDYFTGNDNKKPDLDDLY